MMDKNINEPSRSADELIWSRYLLGNMHCPSCVSHIEEVLKKLHPSPKSISPSLITSWVSVEHGVELSARTIKDSLEDAGFEVCDSLSEAPEDGAILGQNKTPADHGILDRALARFRNKRGRPRQIEEHLQHCKACQSAHTQWQDVSHREARLSDQISASAQHVGRVSNLETRPKHEPLLVVDSVESQDRWQASLAIGGMTCASCSGAITERLKELEYIDQVAVNLISNSCTVEFRGREHKDDLVTAIEGIGYEAVIDEVVNLASASNVAEKAVREVKIMVGKMYCNHCPPKILGALDQLDESLSVLKAPSLQDPVMQVRYCPRAPDFTVRDILAKISATDEIFEPVLYHPPSLEERSRQIHACEQKRLLLRVGFTTIMAIPTFIIGIVFMSLVPSHTSARRFFMQPLHGGISRAQWALFALATPVYFLCADVFHKRALKELHSLWRRESKTPVLQRFYRFGSMNMLMALGTTIAYISSVAQLITAGIRASTTPDNSSFYFDSVVFLTLFLLIGRLIESYSKSRTGDALTLLAKLRPSEALLNVTSHGSHSSETLMDPVSYQSVNVDLLEVGDFIKVLHGASPPSDGTIVKGSAMFDESSLTGESRPIQKSVDQEVFAGTINKGPPVIMAITSVGGCSVLDQIVKAIREGQTRRAPVERIADSLTSYFVPFVTFLAVLTWIVWLSLGYSGALPRAYLGSDAGGWATWSIEFAIAVFVIACPCGLALAAPTALFVGGGIAAQNGILVKGGGEAFERASQLNCVVFDKTGTLTVGGEPLVTDYRLYPSNVSDGKPEGLSEPIMLGMLGALESNSNHIVAKAIASFCQRSEIRSMNAEDVEEEPGKGLKGSFRIQPNMIVDVVIGNETMIRELGGQCLTPTALSTLNEWKSAGKSVAIAAARYTASSKKSPTTEWHLLAIFSISDPIRPEARTVISALHRRDIRVYMLSGDNIMTAQSIGRDLGILPDNIIADVLPGQKAERIRYLQRTLATRTGEVEHAYKRATVAMVGDGINDSPALTAADVGIAIGSGSDIAISSAEFVLVTSNLHALLTLLDLSKAVFRRIKFNFAWALMYNIVALPVAAGVLYPIQSGGKHVRLDPVWASLAMALSSISVVCSSLALRSRVPGVGFRKEQGKEA